MEKSPNSERSESIQFFNNSYEVSLAVVENKFLKLRASDEARASGGRARACAGRARCPHRDEGGWRLRCPQRDESRWLGDKPPYQLSVCAVNVA